MKKFINFLSLALIAMLSFASCSSDNNEPSNSTPANYLEGKTFVWGNEPTAGDKNWNFTYLKFTGSNKGVIYHEFFESGTTPTSDYKTITEEEFTYTYVKPTLTMTITKVVKATILEKGVTREDPKKNADVGKTGTMIVDETLNTITDTSSEDKAILTLKK